MDLMRERFDRMLQGCSVVHLARPSWNSREVNSRLGRWLGGVFDPRV